MWRIVALCWIFTAPVLAGALVVVVLTTSLAADAWLWAPMAGLLGAVYGVPAARCVARFLIAPASQPAAGPGLFAMLRWGWGLPAVPAPAVARPLVARHLRVVTF